jgi:hypothetical protein
MTGAIEQAAAAINAPRPTVAQVFDSVAARHGDPLTFDAVEAASGPVLLDAYVRAIELARQHKWEGDFLEILVRSGSVGPGFAVAAGIIAPDHEFFKELKLQAKVDSAQSVFDPGVLAARFGITARNVCRVHIDGHPAGTGFLIGPGLVVTGYHVIEKALIETGGLRPCVTVVFDAAVTEVMGVQKALSPIPIEVAEAWLIGTSPTPVHERGPGPANDNYLDTIGPPPQPGWDYAVIRLKRSPGPGRLGLRLSPDPIHDNGQIMIFQHPMGAALTGAWANITRRHPSGTRFWHNVWTQPGSSGGPCLDVSGMVVGIHQAGPVVQPNPPVPNRAVPILPLRDLLTGLIGEQPKMFTPITNLAESGSPPVLGREDAQRFVWDGMATDARERILVVRGLPGMGRRMTRRIIRSMLPLDAHVQIDLDAGDMIGENSQQVLGRLLAALGADTAPFESDDRDTTLENKLRLDLLPAVMARIDSARAGRIVWLTILFPNDARLDDGAPSPNDVIDALCAQVERFAWLRIALLGTNRIISAELEQRVKVDALQPITAQNVINYLSERWPLSEPALMAGVTGLVNQALPAPIYGSAEIAAHQKKAMETARFFEVAFRS